MTPPAAGGRAVRALGGAESATADTASGRVGPSQAGPAGLGLALGLVALAGTAVTLVVALVPSAHVAYRNTTLHIALETAIALFGTLLAYLAFGRFRQRRALVDLVVAYAFGVLAVGNLFFSALAGAVGGLAAEQTTTWVLIIARALGAGLLAIGAVAGGRTVARAVPSRAVMLGAAGAIALTTLVLVLIADRFPDAVRVGLDPDASNRPQFSSSPVAVGVQLVTGLLFLLATDAFARRSHRTGDHFPAWLASGCLLAALASVNYAFFPSLYSQWFYIGDLLRLGAYVAWLLGAAGELSSNWEARSRSAALEERRRVARDIHDGLAQELAFVVTQARELADEDEDDSRLAHLASAAERALDESRHAISTLSTLVAEPLDAAVARAAEDIAARTGVLVLLELDTDIELATEVQESLVRIVREAVTNAVRHGRATKVVVRLHATPSLYLEVSDDGEGFDPEAVSGKPDSFGLMSMRERAAAVGGVLRIDSVPGRGTTVAVRWE